MVRRLAASLLLLLCFCARTGEASSVPGAEDYQGMEVASVRIEGVEKDLAARMKKGLALAQGGRGLLGLRGGPIFSPGLLDEDLARCRLFLARHGLPLVRIRVELRPADDRRRVEVTLKVQSEGPLKVGEVVLEGLPDGMDRRKLLDALPLHPGDRFADSAAEAARKDLVHRLRARGHARAEVDLRPEITGPKELRLRYVLHPGEVYTFGRLIVEGPSDDLVPMVHRVAALPRGEPYDPEVVDDIEWFLRQLNLFRRIRLEARPRSDGSLDIHAQLDEREHRRLELGVGWFSDEKLRVSAAWEHRNLFQGGRGLRVSGMRSSIYTNGTLSTWWPGFWGAPNTLVLSLSHQLEREDAYFQRDSRATLALVYRPDSHYTVRGGVALSYIALDDKTIQRDLTADPEGLLTRLFFARTRDGRDDPLFPTEGWTQRQSVELTPPDLGSAAHFARGQAEAAWVTSLRPSLQVAARALVGAGAPFGTSDELIISERFFAGGSRSMRGFKRHRLGPKDAAGNPLGGRFLFEGSTELRMPLYKRLRAALFVDTAQVWRDRDTLLSGGLEWAVGPGLVVRTPVGPLRVDWGFRLGPVHDGEPRSVFHFSVGHPY